ncbi:hypothetical protein ACK8P5_25965 (plasmid) [Paenibacillus sp. EC2-1]|uniref:hypothetical protein n=1 Tax=Paenibacillus sp. EC2-1 TaxID=3388665 RepID=UPI003BEED6E5
MDVKVNKLKAEIPGVFAESGVWIGANGERINISDMDIAHRENTINFLSKLQEDRDYINWIDYDDRQLFFGEAYHAIRFKLDEFLIARNIGKSTAQVLQEEQSIKENIAEIGMNVGYLIASGSIPKNELDLPTTEMSSNIALWAAEFESIITKEGFMYSECSELGDPQGYIDAIDNFTDLKLKEKGWLSEHYRNASHRFWNMIPCPKCGAKYTKTDWTTNTRTVVSQLNGGDPTTVVPFFKRRKGSLYRCPNPLCQDELIIDKDGNLQIQDTDTE